MNEETREAVRHWRARAESDWTAVEVLVASDRCPPDAVCFHCQQFVEKLLKALLTLHGVEAPWTHDLRRLIQLAQPFVPELARLSDAADALTVHGVRTRYPDEWYQIEREEMKSMVELAKELGRMVLPGLAK